MLGLRVWICLGWASLALGAAGCMDMNAVTVDGGFGGPTDVTDGARVISPCEHDLYPEGSATSLCADAVQVCTNTPRCSPIVRCLFDTGCTRLGVDEDINRCGLPCVLGAGVTSPSDPAVINAVAVSNCAGKKYPDVCFPRDAGAPLTP